MRLSFFSKLTSTLFAGFLLSSSAHAVLINFDDLDPATIQDPNGIITTEYESQGVVFEGGSYFSSSSPKSGPNYVVGPGFTFNFVGDLPTYVSFYTGSSTQSMVFIDAVGPNGYFEHIRTKGELHGMNSDESTPYVPNQFFLFTSNTGIASISFSGQSDAYIDDLSFYYAGEAVSEPSTIMLLGLGVLGLILRQRQLL